MPIEFRCIQCGKLLRTGDGTSGRQAQCPACGSLSTVPGPAEAEPLTPPIAPLDSVGPAASAEPPSVGASGVEEPYRSPTAPAPGVLPGQAEQLAALRVSGPATALIVTAVLGMALQTLVLIANLHVMAMQPPRPQIFGNFPLQNGGFHVAACVFGLACGALVLVGAIKMKNLESYALAMTGAIVALIPCTSPCCLLGLPFGIWALVVLGDERVKRAFRS